MTYQDYKNQHRTLGCKITHLIGIPLIMASLLTLLWFKVIISAILFISGWTLQLIGHWVFEGNNPAIFGGPSAAWYGILFWLESVGLYHEKEG